MLQVTKKSKKYSRICLKGIANPLDLKYNFHSTAENLKYDYWFYPDSNWRSFERCWNPCTTISDDADLM
jgi:hypothetical protein